MPQDIVWLMPEDFDDGAAYVRPGMRTPTDLELMSNGVSAGQTEKALDAEIEAAFALVENRHLLARGLPQCQPSPVFADIRAKAKPARPQRKAKRRSRHADARLIEAKRAEETADLLASEASTTCPITPSTGEPPIEISIPISSFSSSSSLLSPSPSFVPSTITTTTPIVKGYGDDETEETSSKLVRAASGKRQLIPWWVKQIKASRYIDEHGTLSENPSIHRHSRPAWRDLCDEARLDFYQDAGIKIAASRPDHDLFHVIINLSHNIEKQAVGGPNALEWCKYRIGPAMTASGLPCSFVMVSEEAVLGSLIEEHRRSDLGLPTRRFHIHALMVLPSSRSAHQKLRDLLRKDAVVGCWDKTAKGRQIGIKAGSKRYVVDYLAKDLHLAGKMLRRFDAAPGGLRYRGYAGGSITVSRDVRCEAIQIYDRWRRQPQN